MPSDDDLNRICDAFGAVLAPALPEWNVLSFQPDAVTTPAGCTADGILELEEGGLRVTLIKAVMRATERAKQLAKG